MFDGISGHPEIAAGDLVITSLEPRELSGYQQRRREGM